MRAVIARVEAGIAADLRMSVPEYRDWVGAHRLTVEHATGPTVATCSYCGRFVSYQVAVLCWTVVGAVETGLGEPGEQSPLAEVRTYCTDLCADRDTS
jgi:hypothetical protein